jgi:ACR3 family arsenite efflux pump ArsB
MYPILCKVRYEVLHLVFRERQLWIQVAFSIVVNWILAPLVMVYFSFAGWPLLLSHRRTGLTLVLSSRWPGHFYQTNQLYVRG